MSHGQANARCVRPDSHGSFLNRPWTSGPLSRRRASPRIRGARPLTIHIEHETSTHLHDRPQSAISGGSLRHLFHVMELFHLMERRSKGPLPRTTGNASPSSASMSPSL